MNRIYEQLEGGWHKLSQSELRSRYQNMIFPREIDADALAAIPDNPYMLLTETEPPEHDSEAQQAIETAPTLVDGELLQQWEIVDLPQSEPGIIIITKVQAIAAMAQAEMLDDFETHMAGADALTKKLWEASYQLFSDSPLLLDVWAALGKTEKELYDMFLTAREIIV